MYVKVRDVTERYDIRLNFFKEDFGIESEEFESELDFTEETAHLILATAKLLLFTQYLKHCALHTISLRLGCALYIKLCHGLWIFPQSY